MARRAVEDTFTLSFIDLLSCMMGGAIILFLVFSSAPSRGRASGVAGSQDLAVAGEFGAPAALWISVSATVDRSRATQHVVRWTSGGNEGIERATMATPELAQAPFTRVDVTTTDDEVAWATEVLRDLPTGEPVVVQGTETLLVGSRALVDALILVRRALPSGSTVFVDDTRVLQDRLTLMFVGGAPGALTLPQQATARLTTSATFRPGSVGESISVCVDLGPTARSPSDLADTSIEATVGARRLRWERTEGLAWVPTKDCLLARIPLRRLKSES